MDPGQPLARFIGNGKKLSAFLIGKMTDSTTSLWAIRTRLQMQDSKRDLDLFNLAIDSKLRGCDVVAIRVEDVAPSGYALDRATIRQKKTGRPVRFELTDQTRSAIDDYLRLTGRKPGQVLFCGRDPSRRLTTRQ